MKRSVILFGAAAIAALIGVALIATPYGNAIGLGPHSTVLSLKESGVESFYPGNGTKLQANNQNVKFAGDAASGNASYTVFEDSAYLHIGVKAPTSGAWAGYYQVTPSTYATLVHAVLVAPANLTGYFTNGIYVQASNQVLNYVTCVAVTNTTGTYWMVIHANKYGNSASDFTFYDILWHDTAKHQALIRDCELVTNGQDKLDVYLDHVLVYHSTSLYLGMQQPFNFFVGVESEYAAQLTYGSSRDFYVTNSDTVKVTGLPNKAAVAAIVDINGKVLAIEQVQSGTAAINLGTFSFPLTGYIKVFDKAPTTADASSGAVASTLNLVDIFGGDVFVLGPNPSTNSQLTIDARDANGNQLNGYYTVVMKEGVQVAADWIPTSFTLHSGQTYTILVSDYGHYVFDHWSDGSISRIRTMAISSATSVAAIFRDANSPPPSGHSLISVSAVDSSGGAITGFYSTLWQNGFMVAQAYSPASFVVDNNNAYQVSISNYGSHVFASWRGGSGDPFNSVSTGTGTTSNLVAVYK